MSDLSEAILPAGAGANANRVARERVQARPVGGAPQAITAPSAEASPLPPKHRGRRLVLLLALLAGTGAAAFYGFDWYTNGRFIISTDDAYVRADVAIIAAKVSGYVADVPVTDNMDVHAGNVLARIDDGDYRLAVEAAQRKLDTQDATIARIEQQTRAQDALVAQARAGLDSARADAVRADADFGRAQRLVASGSGSSQSLDQARADRDRAAAAVQSASAALAAAQGNLAVFGAQKVEAERLGAELKTAVDKAERDLSFTEIRAPFDGTVGNRAAQLGDYVQPGTRLMALVPLQSAYIEANFKETQLARVKAGDAVTFSVDALADRRFAGTVESVAPASGAQFSLLPPENATGNFTKIIQRVPVRIKVAGDVAAEQLLRPGLSVAVDIDTRETRNEPESRIGMLGAAAR